MSKILTIIFFSCIIALTGCSALSNGLIKPELTALKAEQDVNAVKVGGDILPLKGTLEGNNQIGSANETHKTNVGGNLTSTNDSELMKDYISAIKEGNDKLLETMWWIVKALIALISVLSANLFFVVKSLLKSNENDDTFKENLIKGGK